jgi:SAM-dependent methyltransferase
MHYDPIKRSLGNVFNKSPWLRKLFYRLLDLLLLRTWHVHAELKRWARENRQNPAPEILDAGSGFGQYSYYLGKMNSRFRIKAVDVKEEQIADCSNFFSRVGLKNVRFETGDLTRLNEPDTYDLILSVDVMEHILEDELVFRNFHKALKPGGTLIISTPSDQGGSDVGHDEESSFIEEHVRDGYNINDIQDKLKRAGFSETRGKYAYGTPGKIAWKISMKWPIVMLGVSKLFFIILPFYYLIFYPPAFLLNLADVKGNHPTGTGLVIIARK